MVAGGVSLHEEATKLDDDLYGHTVRRHTRDNKRRLGHTPEVTWLAARSLTGNDGTRPIPWT